MAREELNQQVSRKLRLEQFDETKPLEEELSRIFDNVVSPSKCKEVAREILKYRRELIFS
jgi:uncharacterized protein (UPF0335 family)